MHWYWWHWCLDQWEHCLWPRLSAHPGVHWDRRHATERRTSSQLPLFTHSFSHSFSHSFTQIQLPLMPTVQPGRPKRRRINLLGSDDVLSVCRTTSSRYRGISPPARLSPTFPPPWVVFTPDCVSQGGDELSERVRSRLSARRRYVTRHPPPPPAVKVSSRLEGVDTECDSYPAAPSLVVCVELLFPFFASSCALLHPSTCSQCHFSPRDTQCPPQSHGGAPRGSPRQTLCFKPARPITFTTRVLASIPGLLFCLFKRERKKENQEK